ncbi:Alpha/Beta hydrolase protein [Apiospora arundinis]|uniref:Alpha/Beta hydrolase protein n=1 Tax=Apiospora arundinis TaxID=335852 RepID=A0ABR2IVX5_9PEZI
MQGPTSLLLTAATCLQLHARFASAAGADPPLAVPTSPFCQGECHENYTIGWEFDSNNWVTPNLTLDSFWDLPSNLSSAAPGDILRWQDISVEALSANWTIPGGASLSRFQYATEDVDGATVAASAFLLLPYAAPRRGNGKIRTLAWAHGTAGISPVCAPSNHKALYYDWSAVFSYVQLGYAVVAPDYAGLGSTTPRGFQYCAGWTHAADMAFSVVAARQRVGAVLTDDWAAVGQSEGGMTTWRLNQRLAVEAEECVGDKTNATKPSLARAGRFVGSVAIAPADSIIDIIDALADVPPNADGGVLEIVGYIMRNIANLYPGQLRLENYLTEAALGRLELMTHSCVYGAFYALSYMDPHEFYVNASWTSDPAIVDWRRKYNREGLTALAAPLLVVQGADDGIVPPATTERVYNRTCAAHPEARVTYLGYEGLNHDTVTNTAQVDYMAWLDDLFNGKEMEQGCSRIDMHPLSDRFQSIAVPYKASL